jgi:hypothetical protein
MSGKLVGEVIAASDRLRQQGLPERGFHALIAIAEKCHHESRQGSVPWSHIRAGLYGASKRTAERAVGELRRAKLVTVVAKGFKNGHLVRSPIYEMTRLADDTAVAVPDGLDPDTAVAVPTGSDTDTALSVSAAVGTDKPGSRYRQTGPRYRHPGGVLNGSINGPSNGGARQPCPAPPAPPPETTPAEPPPHCTRHPSGTTEPCRACGDARRANERWNHERAQRDAAERQQRRAATDACDRCDHNGMTETPAGLARCQHRGVPR